MKNYLLFSSQSYQYLAEELWQLPSYTKGEIERKTFPDGELYQRILTLVEDENVVLLGGTDTEANTLELFDLACGLVKYGAKTLTIVVPYYGYSTMERAVLHGEVVIAKTRARIFSAVPSASFGNRMVMLDLHSEGIPHYFEGSIRPVHLYGKPLVLDAIKRLGGNSYVLGSTDAGRAKWVQSLGNELNVPVAFIIKERDGSGKTEVKAMSMRVKGKRVVIYDDMIRTGGSLCAAAEAYLSAGAKSVAAVATHGILPQGSLDSIEKSGLFEKICVTNSHPRASQLASLFFEVLSITGLINNFLQKGENATY